MPNDMTPLPASAVSPELLALRTDRYVARARALADDPRLTTEQAARALDHLAGLQAALSWARLRDAAPAKKALRQVEDRYRLHEARLTDARADLSSALLRAKPAGNVAYGIVPHGADAAAATVEAGDTCIERGKANGSGGGNDSGSHRCGKEAPAPVARAVSASRALLDLEALRPFLGEQALRDAIEAHGKKSGRRDLRGVTYAALPTSAHLPCPVT